MTIRYTLTVVLAILAVGLPGAGGGSTHPSAISPTVRQVQPSWAQAGLASQDLLYVTNANGEVTFYRYWKRTRVGVLTNFRQPKGACTDSTGNIYITDAAQEKIFEYAHGGVKPIKTFDDSPYTPYACSVDAVTGSLAVVNNEDSAPGSLVIWAPGSQPVFYTSTQLYNFVGCAYDGSGNLLVTDGYRYGQAAAFAWLPKDGTQLINLYVPGPSPSWKVTASAIQWDGKYFVLDQSGGVLRIALIHGQAYYVGKTEFAAEGNSNIYAIYNNKPNSQGNQIVAAVNEDGEEYYIDYWHYPAGGDALY